MTSIANRLERLGVRRLLLAIHDTSFPSDPDEDIGRGTPASRAAGRLFAYAKDLGFTGIQLGPQGMTPRDNPSPYGGTLFARHLGNASLAAFEELAGSDAVRRAVLPEPGGPVQHAHAFDALQRLLDLAHRGLMVRPDLRVHLRVFRHWHGTWLERDGLYEALARTHGGADHRCWPSPDRDLWLTGTTDERDALVAANDLTIERFALGQYLVHGEHARVRADLEALGLALHGELPVGYSDRDVWSFAPIFLRGYRLGAAPSRSSPDGVPWGYPVLDPTLLAGAARAFVLYRSEKAFAEYDSLRIMEADALVCPWVYAAETGDDQAAVRAGTWLFEPPDLPEHRDLARYAIARSDQLDASRKPHADRWVTGLDPVQVDRYAMVFEALVTAARRNRRHPEDLSCEVRSATRAPLGAVLARYGLGRLRVAQQANLDDPRDVSRSENAEREDWVTLGNHDTAPIFAAIRDWSPAHREAWARHLAGRLRITTPARLEEPGYLASAMLAELFLSRAENVEISFTDLFGYEEAIASAGGDAAKPWTVRLPPDFVALRTERLARGAALDLALATELALAAREPR